MGNKKVFCTFCGKEILDEEFRVNYCEKSLKPITIDLDINFHRPCWVEHYNQSIDKKVNFMAKKIMKNSLPMINELARDGRISF